MKIPFLTKRNEKRKAENERMKELARVPSFNTPILKYGFTPSYISLGKRWGTLIKLANIAGMNHDAEFSWAVNLLPNIDVVGVKGYLVAKDVVTDESTEKLLADKELDKLLQSTRQNGISRFSSQQEEYTKAMNIQDIEEMKTDLDRKGRIVDAELILLIVSDSVDKISQQLTRLQRYYDKQINGVQLSSLGGEQEHLFKDLFKKPEPNRFNLTWSTQDFAGNDLMIRKGLSDRHGWAIGSLAVSYTSGTAMMDLDGSFTTENIKNKGAYLVATPSNATIRGYEQFRGLSASSMWGQLIANNTMVAGVGKDRPAKTIHIVLNGFDFYQSLAKGEDKFVTPESFLDVAKYVDLSEGGLNPLEGFGENRNANTVYNNKIKSLARIIYLLSERAIDKDSIATLEEALRSFYLGNGYWSDAAAEKGNGYLNRFMNLENHRNVGTFGDFTKKITNYMSAAVNSQSGTGAEEEVRKISRVVKAALESHPELFNTWSTQPNRLEEGYLQYYFDLSRLMTEQEVQEAQLLNVLPYVLASAKENDVIVIHGMNRISADTWDFIEKSLEQPRNKGVRFGYLFDTIGSQAIKMTTISKVKEPKLDMFNAKGTLYQNIDSDFDFTIIGMMDNAELSLYEKEVSSKGVLPTYIKETLNSSGKQNTSMFQVRRPSDFTSNVIVGDFPN